MFFCDFHTHSFASDGVLSRVELIRRASLNGYKAIAVTDHIGGGDLEANIKACAIDCEIASRHWDIKAIPGVELTHIPPEEIGELAKKAKALGAKIVIIHGETPVEPVIEGTNEAAVGSEFVDILSHPGFISPKTAKLAAGKGVFLELSLRKGHCLTNGYIAKIAQESGAKLLVNTDAHKPEELMTEQAAVNGILGAGIDKAFVNEILERNAKALIEKIGF
jgi:histidinol phosphatase-like PHP family hydrolase